MIDHIGLTVTDIEKSRAFYEAALRPLGFKVLMVAAPSETESGGTAVMFGIDSVEFVIADNEPVGQGTHVAFRVETRALVDAFTRQRSRPAGATTGRQGSGRNTARPIMRPSCMTLTGSMSRRCAALPSRPDQALPKDRRRVSDGLSPKRRR
jgi:catechol 2,3-dioxygenase-like lactoylglutathione lyase family enzyme